MLKNAGNYICSKATVGIGHPLPSNSG